MVPKSPVDVNVIRNVEISWVSWVKHMINADRVLVLPFVPVNHPGRSVSLLDIAHCLKWRRSLTTERGCRIVLDSFHLQDSKVMISLSREKSDGRMVRCAIVGVFGEFEEWRVHTGQR